MSDPRTEVHRQAASITVALIPFGLVFGVASADAGLAWWQAGGFSTLVFSGSAQFAAVEILGDGGTVAAAVTSGILLNVRELAFGVVMAPALAGPPWRRALESQLMIDESTAVGTAQSDLRWRRYGYLVGGLSVFVFWNATTLIGFGLGAGTGDVIDEWGLDAAAPAAFLALLWPRLADRQQRAVAVAGALMTTALVPFAAAGLPILGSIAGVAVLGLRRRRAPEPSRDV